MAAIMCQDFVKKRLKAPSTATFPNIYQDGTTTKVLAEGRYQVQSYVDAQNGFGAQIRSQWNCTIQKSDGDSWRLIDLTIQ